ncbi:MAG: alpha/beta hydrolase [Archangium sp.]
MEQTIRVGAVDLTFDTHGDASHPTVLLIMGLAAQLIHWSDSFIDALVKRGFHVVRFDNRDSGRSTHFDGAPADFPAALRGDFSNVAYTFSDMANDTVGLLDALHIDSAHLVGASLGGAIAQTIALEHRTRVRTLTSMMTGTGDPKVGFIHPEAGKVVFSPAKTREEVIARAIRSHEVTGSPLYPTDPKLIAERAGRAWDRDHDPLGPVRQGIASLASGDRTERLRTLDVPTLIIHGLADTLCDPSGGRAAAAAIPNAELHLIEGMGHELPAQLHERLATLISSVAGKR